MTESTDFTEGNSPSSDDRPATPLETFTQTMTSLREESGYSQENAAVATRISVQFVRALEEGRFEHLPGRVFVLGFIRTLCKAYGADAAGPLELLDRCDWDSSGGPADLAPAVSRQNYKKTSNVVRLQKNTRKPSLFKQIHWRTFSKTMVLYLVVPIIGVATILLSLKTIKIDTVGGWVTSIQDTIQSVAFDQEPSDTPAPVAQGRLPLDIAVLENDSPLEWQNIPTLAGITAKERLADRIGHMDASPFDIAVLTPKPTRAKETAEIVDGTVAKVTASARVPARVQASASSYDQASTERTGALTKGDGITPSDTRSVITVQVIKPVKIRFKGANGSKTMTLKPDTYQYPFATSLETLIFDASRVKISFNGKNLGNIGSKGRVRKLTFHHKKTSQ